MNEPLASFDDYGPADRLFAAIRRCAPRMAVSVIYDEKTGLSRVRVSYRHAGPWAAKWDGTRYRLHRGGGPRMSLPADAEKAAEVMAKDLLARVGTGQQSRPDEPRTSR